MTSTFTTHFTSSDMSMDGSAVTTLVMDASMDSTSTSSSTSMSVPSSPVSVTGMSGLLNSRNLVQDEKLVVATLATLDFGSASNVIKQDLKWVIQSRRRAEGKADLQVEFKKPVKDQLTSEELVKRARRRELNRLAARRSRQKGQKHKDRLIEEIHKLQAHNTELLNILEGLTEQRNDIVKTLRQHMSHCTDYRATQSVAVGISQRVLELLGFPSHTASHSEVQELSGLCIGSGRSLSPADQLQSPPVTVKGEQHDLFTWAPSALSVGVNCQLPETKVVSKSSVRVTPKLLASVKCETLVSYPTPVIGPHHESSSQHSTRSWSSTHSSLGSNNTAMSDSSSDVADDGITHYKHKLMKHRTDYLPKPSSETSSGTKLGLERSLSFPSAVRESRLHQETSSSGSYASGLIQTQDSWSAACSGSKTGASYSPLDLAAKRGANSLLGNQEVKHLRSRYADTWPPRDGVLSRWSVDGHQPLFQHHPGPLNLSSKVKLRERDLLVPETGSSDRMETCSKYSSFTVDSYR